MSGLRARAAGRRPGGGLAARQDRSPRSGDLATRHRRPDDRAPPRGTARAADAARPPLGGMAQDELVPGAGHGHVEQPPLLGQRCLLGRASPPQGVRQRPAAPDGRAGEAALRQPTANTTRNSRPLAWWTVSTATASGGIGSSAVRILARVEQRPQMGHHRGSARPSSSDALRVTISNSRATRRSGAVIAPLGRRHQAASGRSAQVAVQHGRPARVGGRDRVATSATRRPTAARVGIVEPQQAGLLHDLASDRPERGGGARPCPGWPSGPPPQPVRAPVATAYRSVDDAGFGTTPAGTRAGPGPRATRRPAAGRGPPRHAPRVEAAQDGSASALVRTRTAIVRGRYRLAMRAAISRATASASSATVGRRLTHRRRARGRAPARSGLSTPCRTSRRCGSLWRMSRWAASRMGARERWLRRRTTRRSRDRRPARAGCSTARPGRRRSPGRRRPRRSVPDAAPAAATAPAAPGRRPVPRPPARSGSGSVSTPATDGRSRSSRDGQRDRSPKSSRPRSRSSSWYRRERRRELRLPGRLVQRALGRAPRRLVRCAARAPPARPPPARRVAARSAGRDALVLGATEQVHERPQEPRRVAERQVALQPQVEQVLPQQHDRLRAADDPGRIAAGPARGRTRAAPGRRTHGR